MCFLEGKVVYRFYILGAKGRLFVEGLPESIFFILAYSIDLCGLRHTWTFRFNERHVSAVILVPPFCYLKCIFGSLPVFMESS